MNTSADVVIIGAGIAGLWLHNRLNNMGFHALLLENKTIGNAQTLSSQGIIHGGAKYALNGIFSKATQAIGAMPDRWKSCLQEVIFLSPLQPQLPRQTPLWPPQHRS